MSNNSSLSGNYQNSNTHYNSNMNRQGGYGMGTSMYSGMGSNYSSYGGMGSSSLMGGYGNSMYGGMGGSSYGLNSYDGGYQNGNGMMGNVNGQQQQIQQPQQNFTM